MANEHDSTKTPPPPPPPPPTGPSGPGTGVKPQDVYKPPQLREIALIAGAGGAVGGLIGALLAGCVCAHLGRR